METIREYGDERLAEHHETEILRARHAESLETDNWDRLNHIRELHEQRAEVLARLTPSASDAEAEAAVETGNEATDHLYREVDDLMVSARRLHLFASLVDNAAFRDRFGRYLIAILNFDISCRVASERTESGGKAWAHVPDPDTMVRVPLRDLLRDGNRLLGFEWWDPDDVTRYLPDSEDQGP